MTEPVHLYYDAGCGPCTFFALTSRGLGRGRIAIFPLASPGADRELGRLPTDDRFGAFHLVYRDRILTGAAAVVPLVGLALGRPAERVARGAPPLRRGLERTYRWFWRYRRTRGCAAAAP